MKNKNFTLLFIAFLGMMALAIVALLIFLLLDKKNILFTRNVSSTLLVDEYYSSNVGIIHIESISSDIRIKEAEDNQIHVLIYGSEKEIAESKLGQNTLNISLNGKHFCFGFCFFKEEIIVYVPKEISTNIEVKTTSGDLELVSLLNADVNLKTTSGDIKLGEVKNANLYSTSGEITLEKGENVQVKTTSGDIFLNQVKTKVEAESISGDIKINSFAIEENSKIKTTSGDVLINEIKNAYIETSTVSGDIAIENNNRYASNILTIKTTSGDIHVK